jgi:hypothetical protein
MSEPPDGLAGPPPPDPYAYPAPGPYVPPGPHVPPDPYATAAPTTGPPNPWDPYGYGYAPVPERAPGTDGFAIAAFVLGLLGAIPLAIIFGILGLRRIGRTRRGGKGLAIAGLIFAGAWVIVLAAGVAVWTLRGVDRSNSGSIVTAGRVAAADLRVGDCIQFPAATTITVKAFDAVPCSQPHDAEAYSGGDLPLNGAWPGETAVRTATDQKCAEAFEPFVGTSIDNTALSVSFFYPEQNAWDAGDRGYICVVGADGSKTSGTLKGANR